MLLKITKFDAHQHRPGTVLRFQSPPFLCHSTELAYQTWSTLTLTGPFSPIFEHVWCECSPLPVGGTLCSELLQLGLSFTNSVLEPSEALYFYLCSATLTRCFRCDGTKTDLVSSA